MFSPMTVHILHLQEQVQAGTVPARQCGLALALKVRISVANTKSIRSTSCSYLKSSFHILNAIVIIASSVVDVAVRGGLEEAGSLFIIVRLWRVFQITEEFSARAGRPD